MFGKGKSTEERMREKERKKRGTRRYGQANLRHSHMGIYSCWFATGSFAILLGSILIAFFMHGETGGFIGGFGILSIVLAVMGIRAGVTGLRDRETNYLTCKIGMSVSIVVLLVLVVIFIGGC